MPACIPVPSTPEKTRMPCELGVNGQVIARCDTEEEAVGLARERLADAPDTEPEPEVVNLATGEPATPGGTAPARQDLANKISY
jgi:hypothetical protein